MTANDLKNKKITLTTLKSFIKKNSELYVSVQSQFDSMVDGVRPINLPIKQVTKNNAIGIDGVWVTDGSKNYFSFAENEIYFGIKVSNCCGTATLWTPKQ
jgi:hypothetical protein